ncbi:DNA gyrase C-terminal beta-propeller domain-containing protein, partial [Patescibacteria group bacterium]
DDLLFFSTKGKVYQTKMYEIPESSRTAKGKSVVNFLALSQEEEITSVVSLSKKQKKAADSSLVMVTKKGIIKKTSIDYFSDVRRSGIIAIALQKGDTLNWARIIDKKDTVMLFTKKGLAIRFKESDIRNMLRSARGVKAINLKSGDELVDCEIIGQDLKDAEILVVSKNGFGKKSRVKEFKIQKRGGTGIKAMAVSQKTGNLVNASIITEEKEEFIIVSKKGKTLRTKIKEIPLLGRATQGVRIMKLESIDSIASMTLI